MRIGINASFVRKPYTGTGQVTVHFLETLAKKKDWEKILGLKKEEYAEFFLYFEENFPLKSGGNIHKRNFLPLWKRDDLIRKIWWEKRILPKKIRQDKCDVFISLYQCPTILDSSISHLMVVHDIIPKLFLEYRDNARKKYYWDMTEDAICKADKIIAVSKRTEKDLIKHLGVKEKNVTVAYIDVDNAHKKEVSTRRSLSVMKKYGLTQGYFYYGGGLDIRKNADNVIKAYRILLERNKSRSFTEFMPPLVISGKLMPQLAPLIVDVEKIIKEYNLSQKVILLDFVPQEDLPALYSNALAFIFPSRYEGFGMPVLEAMNQGTPVITSKTSSLPEVGGDAVLYCDPEDPKDIAMVMKNVLINKELRHTLSQRGKQRAKNFSWDDFVEKVVRTAVSM